MTNNTKKYRKRCHLAPCSADANLAQHMTTNDQRNSQLHSKNFPVFHPVQT